MPIQILSDKISPTRFSGDYARLERPHIIVEGPDFSGKSSLCRAFGAAGISIDSELREPNEAVRKMLRSGAFAQRSLREQAELMEESRADIAERLIQSHGPPLPEFRHRRAADNRYVHVQDRGFPSTYVNQLRSELKTMYEYSADAGACDTYLRMFFDRQLRIGLAPTAVLVLLPEAALLESRVEASQRAQAASGTSVGGEAHPGMDDSLERVLEARKGYVDFCRDFNARTVQAGIRLVKLTYSHKLLDNPAEPTPSDKRFLWSLVGHCTS